MRMSEGSAALQQSQRVHVEIASCGSGKRVKISLESFEERLGWYTAGSLSLPLHELPLLEQALAEARGHSNSAGNDSAQIIPFPGMMSDCTT